MTCSEFENRLDEALHRGSSLRDAEWAGHAGTCPACAESLESARRLQDGLAALKTRQPSADLADRVLARWAAEQETAKQPAVRSGSSAWRSRVALMAAVAALLLVAVRIGSDRLAVAPQPVAKHTAPKVPEIVSQDEPPVTAAETDVPVEELVRSAQTAYLALAQNAAHTLKDAAQVVVPPKTEIPTLETLAPATPASLNSWKPKFTIPESFGEWLDKSG